ncbi:MAG: 5-methyltetrahydropteroyltriglutamate--homocysteine S-methyltransferase, partial [Spirochaetes bacterium]|nr:5-methyltetrahydropteroyltriglutamate--homocysteine S-methyltransferase [Spirochaetota bacterium]
MSGTSVIGFPRIGEKRELKRATEDYFAGNLDYERLAREGAGLRRRHWLLQKEKGIDLITSNDFSLYDTVLDAAFMLNAIPKRFAQAGLSDADTCFAMAKGYQKGTVDLKALDMKKWFNTNYHYVVPELDEGMEFLLRGDKAFAEFTEARAAGVETLPALIGPFTFLKLSRIRGALTSRMREGIAGVYRETLRRLASVRSGTVRFDEPSLVTDLDAGDLELFSSLYGTILRDRGPLKALLQTYFGDIGDAYDAAMRLDFDAVGLDFVEGAGNLDLLRERGWPRGRTLVAGLVNGKNVWRNDYSQSLSLLEALESHVPAGNIVIGTSCSLLHVPYSTRHEVRMPERYRRHLAFAEEKLSELTTLASLFRRDDCRSDPAFRENQTLIGEKRDLPEFRSPEVRRRVASLTEEDFRRRSPFVERTALQRRRLNLPPLPTTTIGSFPQTPEVRALRNDLRKGTITEEEYDERLKKMIRDVIALQEEIGIDVLVHGEFERSDMVEYFGEHLSGFLFTENGWVQSYGTRGVKPPIIFGDVSRPGPITVPWISYAQSLTAKPVKGMLTGPVTILNWSFPREDLPLRDIALQIALAIRDEVADLERAGIGIIQVDEAALREKLPMRRAHWRRDYLDWAIRAFRLASSPVTDETQIQTHMCYSEFSDIMEEIKEMDADVLLIEAAKSDFSVLDSLREHRYDKDVGPGVYDIHSPRVPGREEIEGMIRIMKEKFDPASLWVNPDCGLKTRGFQETVPSLRHM